MGNRIRDWVWWVLFVGLGTLLSLHFLILFFYTMPLSPIKYSFSIPIDDYADTFFTQNWHLFAPNPVQDNIVVAARARNFSDTLHTYTASTDWVDLTDPLIWAVQKDRFSELQVPELMLSNAAILFVDANGLNPHSATDAAIRRGDDPLPYLVLARYAAHVLGQLTPPGHYDRIQLSITVTEPPSFLDYGRRTEKVVDVSIYPPMPYPSTS